MVDSTRLRARMDLMGLSQSELARRANVAQPTIFKLMTGQSRTSNRIHAIASELGTTVPYLMGEVDDPEAGFVQRPSLDEVASKLGLVPVREVDLTRGFDLFNENVPVTGEEIHFDRKWLQRFTEAAPEYLYYARSLGDAMSPTISASDSILVDTTKVKVNISDRIWAVIIGETIMVKRLRAIPNGFELISDNPLIPPASVVSDEMRVIGRVVSIIHQS